MNGRRMRRWGARGAGTAGLVLAAALAMAGCDDDGTEPRAGAVFEVEVSGETFRLRAGSDAVAADLQRRMDSGVEGVVLGALLPGAGGVNPPWSWHLDPATVQVADLAVEVCDGRPSMVEADLDYWLETVGTFCPWGARVVGRSGG